MTKDSEQIQKRFRATPSEKLQKFDPECIAFADGGSQIFLLLGDATREDRQHFIIARILAKDENKYVEFLGRFDARWRCSALLRFKRFLDGLQGGYSYGGFLEAPRREGSLSPLLGNYFSLN